MLLRGELHVEHDLTPVIDQDDSVAQDHLEILVHKVVADKGASLEVQSPGDLIVNEIEERDHH